MIDLLIMLGLSVPPVKQCLQPELLASRLSDSVVQVIVKDRNNNVFAGTGLVADSKGDVVTSTHVIASAKEIVVLDTSGNSFSYSTLKIGNDDSVSSLKPSNPLKHPSVFTGLTDTHLSVGEPLFTMGHPLGMKQRFSAGHLASIEGQMVMSDIPMYPGMSGSPVFDCEGHVAGFILGYISAPTLGVMNHYLDAKEVL
jgi:S1-C subfamily serine protease